MKNKLLFSVFVYFVILTLLSLGFWQIYRLNWKLDLIEQIENSLKNDPVELSNIEKKNYLRIKTSGEIDFDNQIYLYNLNDAGKPGFEVINPIKIGDENYLLNRGWISFEKKDLRLTEREIEIILFLNSKDKSQSIDVLQKEVWGYSENLETHTVETHVYRLRKKINETFDDSNFLVSSKDGYKI